LEFPLGGDESSLRSVLDIHDSSEQGSQQRGKPKCEEYIAHLAQNTWSLIQEWELSLANLANYPDEETATFLTWAKNFTAYCDQHQLIDETRLPDLLIAALNKHQLTLPFTNLIFYGFEKFTPQTQRLKQALANAGYIIQEFDPNIYNAETLKYLVLSNQQEEILTMTRFAKTYLTNNPNALIGCVVPNLNTLRNFIESVVNKVFVDEPRLINISLGKPLLSYPIINAALQLLELGSKTAITFAEILNLLHTPFCAWHETEWPSYAAYEHALYQAGNLTYSLNDLVNLLEHVKENSLFIKELKNYNQKINAFPGKRQSIKAWANFFMKLLDILGWPGERFLTGDELELKERLLTLLTNEFPSLDLVHGSLGYSEALNNLKALARQCLFQPGDNSASAKVHILGSLEAAGLNFDYLWVMGANNRNFPEPPHPNPLLPLAIQKAHNLPHASFSGELEYAKTLIRRFAHSAPKVIFSFSEQIDESEQKNQISALVTELPNIRCLTIQELNLTPQPPHCKQTEHSDQLEFTLDGVAPAVSANETIRGGSKIIKLQALCPFRAFAECRLNARELRIPEFGISKLEHGNLVHKALEKIWQEIQTHANLIALSEQQLQEIITVAIDFACQKCLLHKKHVNKNSFKIKELLIIEREFLGILLKLWLEWEKQRPPFKIESLEKKINGKIGELALELVIDRIDRLADGSLVVIDYKTGTTPKLEGLFGDRPEEPQLPLYCTLYPEPITGIIFAKIVTRETGFHGLAKNDTEIVGVKKLSDIAEKLNLPADWQELCATWQSTFTTLAADFMEGKAEVNPKNDSKTCEFCPLKILCRVC